MVGGERRDVEGFVKAFNRFSLSSTLEALGLASSSCCIFLFLGLNIAGV